MRDNVDRIKIDDTKVIAKTMAHDSNQRADLDHGVDMTD
jgi:hypothetical protein